MSGLGLLAAKSSAHTAALDAHSVVVQPQRMRHPVLHLAGVLGAAVHHPLVLLLRQHVGNLALQIEMLLSAHFQRAAQRVLGAGHGGAGIAPAYKNGWQYIAFGLQGLLHRQDGGQGFDVKAHLARRSPGLHHRFGNDQTDDLADVLHRVHGKHRLIAGKGGQHGVAGNVFGQHHVHHAWHGQRVSRIHTAQAAVRHGGEDGCRVQGAAHLGDVVDVVHCAGHLGHRTFVRFGCSAGAHGVTPLSVVTVTWRRSVSAEPWLSSQNRCIRLPSTVLR